MRTAIRLMVALTTWLATGPAWAEVSVARKVTVPPAVGAATAGTGDLRLAVGRCWNVAALSQDALKVRVTVGLDVDAGGRPVFDTIQLMWPRGDDDMDAQHMYETARRAIVRCGQDGLPMPAGRRGAAQRLELTFDATGLYR